jgi:hypothetical protein
MKYRFLLIFFLLPIVVQAQHYYRVKADFSFKFKGDEVSGSSLVMGTAYFDKIAGKITYRVKFPRPEVWVMQDTSMYKFREGKLVERTFVPSPVEMSIFNLALQSNMNNFGLESSVFTLESVERDQGMVITTWNPPPIEGENRLGQIIIANQDGLLKGVVFKNEAGNVVAKQFYDDYTTVSGIHFPKEITQINYAEDGTESYQVTNYKNIIIDESGEDHWYRFAVDQ